MTRDAETRLREALRTELPPAPEDLQRFLDDLGDRRRPSATFSSLFGSAFAVLLIVALGIGAFALWVGSPARLGSNVSTATPTTSPSPTQTWPATVDGLPVHSVAELLADRAAGKAAGGPFALHGYWTVRIIPAFCAPSVGGQAGALEVYCNDGEFGITDADEPIFDFQAHAFRDSTQTSAQSAHLTPWFASEEIAGQLEQLPGHWWTPVPIVVVGHFDDPGAAACRPDAVTKCRDRFVIDRVVQFDPTAVPAPTASPTPTPFPIADPPPPPITPDYCFAGLPKSFVGWARLGDLGITLNPTWDPNEYVYAVITRDVVPIGDPTISGEDTWHTDPNYPGHKVRWWGRQACLTQVPYMLNGGTITGSTYLEIDDGRHIVAPYPFF